MNKVSGPLTGGHPIVHFTSALAGGTIDCMATHQLPSPGALLLDDREQGFWCPVELRILQTKIGQLTARELSDAWLPFHSEEQILAKAIELNLVARAGNVVHAGRRTSQHQSTQPRESE